MIKEFIPVVEGLQSLIPTWESKLLLLPVEVITERRNSQNRTIKQILGHMVDSASNNLHRVVHLQYQESPLDYPNYATFGNNDRWIAIQNFQEEDWELLVQLWKFSNLHYAHVIQFINPDKLKHEWIAGEDLRFNLQELVVDYLRHFQLHLDEMDELINQ